MFMQFMQPNRNLCWDQVWSHAGILKGAQAKQQSASETH